MRGLEGLKGWFSSPRIRRLVDRFLTSDPGLQRLRNAVRIMLVVAAAALISYPIVAGGSTIAPLFGGIVGLLATLVVGDDDLKQRRITTLLLFVPASLSATLGALLASTMWLKGLALLVIVFFVLYLRRFGPRYVAIGMMSLIPLFLSSFVQFGVGQLPWIIISAAVGVICAYLFRFFLIPDRPESVLRRSMATFDIQLSLTLDAVIATIEDCRSDEDRGKRLRSEADRLNECVTAAEGWPSADDASVSQERADRLRLYLFDTEMSANTLSEVAWRYATSEFDLPSEVRDSLLQALRELRATLRERDSPDGEALRALEELEGSRERAASSKDATNWSFQMRRAEAAIRQISGSTGEEHEESLDSTESEEDSGDTEEDGDSSRGGIFGKLRPTTIQGIQATLASGLALLAGEALSPSRPYWVVITAFVVFMGSGTLGDTLSRGFQRTAGTLLGALVGFFLATVASGNLYLELPLIVASIFFAFYLLPISQAMMVFWVTVLLAVAYGLIGQLGSGILALRAFDTLLGSAIGLAVSALVLPTRTSDRIRECIADFLDALEGYIRNRIDQLAGGDTSRHPIEEAREMENKLREVTQNATIVRKQAMVFGRSRSDLDRLITALKALNYYARHLAGPVSREQRLEEDQNQHGELLREVGERIATNLGSLREALSSGSGGEQPEIQDIEDLMEQLESDLEGERAARDAREPVAEPAGDQTLPTVVSPVPGQPAHTNALHYLRRINRTLGELSTMPGIEDKKRTPQRS